MTFLVALAMGTMYCVTVIQFIPEALGKRPYMTNRLANFKITCLIVFQITAKFQNSMEHSLC